ncbi:MAG: PAS domain-containing protein [Alphaproteobacteria bacterium]|nr:PAS domain-containing protein [Alphaproteobacteria bacterium]
MTALCLDKSRLVDGLAVAAPAGVVLAALAWQFAVPAWAAALAWVAVTLPAVLHLARRARPPAPAPAFGVARAAHRLGRAPTTDALARHYDAILDTLPDPLLLLDGAGRVAGLNQAARAMLGDSAPGSALESVIADPTLLAATRRVLDGGASRDLEVRLRSPVNRTFAARIEALPARAGDATAVMLVLHDLTEVRRTEKMRADFVANASHEIRTPLTTLVGFIETLRGPARDDPESRDRFLSIMEQQASRMTRLVDDLLSLSRIEINEHTVPTGRVDLRETLQAVTWDLGARAEAKGMTIAIAAPDELPFARGETGELRQVFQNLLDNAIKYGDPATTVRVGVRVLGERPQGIEMAAGGPVLAVAVADRSEGIPPEHLSRLTERFYRVNTARSRALGGTGLGLAIVKHILSRHRGALQIDSTQGSGSTFTVYLPAAPAEGRALLLDA